MVTIEQFIEQISPFAIRAWHSHQILPSLTIAQGILESQYGNSILVQKANNYFGIKASNWTGAKYLHTTKEFVNGKWITTREYFRKYNNMQESVEDKSIFLSKPRYSKIKGCKDYKVATYEIWKAGYATDPKYPEKLNDLIERYDLRRFDIMAMQKVDTTNVSDWAKADWIKMTELGVLADGEPQKVGTRQEAIAFIRRIDNLLR